MKRNTLFEGPLSLLFVCNILFANAQNQYDGKIAILAAAGQPMPDIFVEGKQHMNAKGYTTWQKIIEPYLF